MRIYEIPVIIGVEADDREEAENEVDDLADCIADTFPTRVRSATAVVSTHHEVLTMLQINPDGEPA